MVSSGLAWAVVWTWGLLGGQLRPCSEERHCRKQAPVFRSRLACGQAPAGSPFPSFLPASPFLVVWSFDTSTEGQGGGLAKVTVVWYCLLGSVLAPSGAQRTARSEGWARVRLESRAPRGGGHMASGLFPGPCLPAVILQGGRGAQTHWAQTGHVPLGGGGGLRAWPWWSQTM